MKILTIILALVALTHLSYAQPKSQNLSSIDPRLVNGFTMTEMKLTGKEYMGLPTEGTESGSNTKMLIGLQKLQALEVKGNKSKFFFKVIPYFSFNSWLLDTVKQTPALLASVLNHEQVHYNIHLLMAHELYKQLSAAWFESHNYANDILGIRNELSIIESKARQLYQVETSNHRDTVAQKKWDDMVNKALENKDWTILADYIKGKF